MKTRSRRCLLRLGRGHIPISAAIVFLCLLGLGPRIPAEVPDRQPETPNRAWTGPDGNRLPFENDDQILDFLRTAEFRRVVKILGGVTRSKQILLEKDGIQAHAVYHYRHIVGRNEELTDRTTVRHLRDSYLNQAAAYDLSRVLGISSVPPTVLREISGQKGSVQLWIENAFSDKDRIEKNLRPTDTSSLISSTRDMRVFDSLINNIDRTSPNILYDPQWNRWLIDHTRAFGRGRRLRDRENLNRICESLWSKLKELDDRLVFKTLEPYMGRGETESLLRRRDLIIAHFQERIELKGKEKVVFDCSNSR